MARLGLLESLKTSYLRKWSLIGILIGIVAGLGSIVFFEGLKFGTYYLLGHGAGFFPPEPSGNLGDTANWVAPGRLWLIPVVITLGGLASGFRVRTVYDRF